MIQEIIKQLESWIEPFKTWVETNHGNPIMWTAFFLIGLAVFGITYSVLNKNQ